MSNFKRLDNIMREQIEQELELNRIYDELSDADTGTQWTAKQLKVARFDNVAVTMYLHIVCEEMRDLLE